MLLQIGAAMTLEGIPSSPETEAVFGGWLEVATRVGRFVSQLPGLHGASVVIGLLTALNDAQNDQTALLRSIKADTAALRVAPLKEALHSLEDAQRVGLTDSSWSTFIGRAEAKLSEARELVSSPQEEAFVEFNLGIVWLAIGNKGNASHHLELSAACATRVVDEYVRKASYALEDARPSPVRRRISRKSVRRLGLAANILLVPALAAGPPLSAKMAAERRTCSDLKDFIGFYNLIQHTASGVSIQIPM